MRKTTTTLLATLVLVSFAAMSVATHDPGSERSATFVGSTLVEHDLNEQCADAIGQEECVTRIPQGIIFIACDDHEGHPYTGGLYDGIGGVGFCLVPEESTVSIQYSETVGTFGANGIVTCPATDPKDPDAVQWNQEIGRVAGEAVAAIDVPEWCDDSGEEGSGLTSVNVFNTAASLTEETVGVIVEGTLTLEY